MEEKQNDGKEQALSGEILAEAKAKAELALQQAEEESRKSAEALLARARLESDTELKDAAQRIARERQVAEAGLLLEERMRRLRVQGQRLEEVFNQALDRLRARAGFDYVRVVTDLAVEAVLALLPAGSSAAASAKEEASAKAGPGDAFVLRLAKKDIATLKDRLPGDVSAAVKQKTGRNVRITVADAPGLLEGGVLVESADGRTRVDNSFAGRLRRMEDELRFEVAEVLFGKVVEAGAPGKEKTA